MSSEKSLYQQIWSKDQWRGLPVYRALLTPIALFERAASAFTDRVGVVDGERRMTYGEFAHRVYRLASALRAEGVKKGDRVALFGPNSHEILEAHMAVPQIGAVLVPINIRLSPGEVGYILDHSGATALIASAELAAVAGPAAAQAPSLQHFIWFGGDPGAAAPRGVGFEAFLAKGRPEPFPYVLDDEEATLGIYYTSGTTGRPRGVMLHHRQGYLNALGEMLAARLSVESVYLWTLPMFHAGGWGFPWAVTGAGARHILLPKVEPARVFRLLETEGVTHLCAAPTVLIMLAEGAPAKDFRFPHPLRIVTAGAPPPPAVIERVERMGADIVHVYGLTEVFGPHTVCEWWPEWNGEGMEVRAKIKARQGVGYVHAPEVRVVDDAMEDVPADARTLGEVVMRGNNVMKGYYRDEEATERAFRGGWFHSGDLAVMHPNGAIELRDRMKDVIISGGENITTVEVEQALYRHPAILEVAVVGVPDPRWGEVPKAYVTLKEGAQATDQEIIAFCKSQIAHFKCPKQVEFGPLPKTSTGKIQKFKLRERAAAGQPKSTE